MASKMNVQEIKKSFSRYDIRIIIKFSVLLGKSATDIHTDLLAAIGDRAPSIQTTRKWMRAISEGRIDMDDDSRSGRPMSACGDAGVSAVEQSLADDRRKSCEEIADELPISSSSVHRILTEKLDKKKMFSKWVPHLLTPEQKEARVKFSRQFLRRFRREHNRFIDRIVTGDETWVYSWDPELKRQSAEWRDRDEPRPEKARRKQGSLKVMHIFFFDTSGVILRWPVPAGTTVNAQYYKMVLQDKLRPAIRKKRPGLLESGVIFHHDNAPVHTARVITELLDQYEWSQLEHPRYSPDLAPCDFWLFPKMKEHLRGQRFESEEDIICATKEAIRHLDKDAYVTAFDCWLRRMQKCIDIGGCYTE